MNNPWLKLQREIVDKIYDENGNFRKEGFSCIADCDDISEDKFKNVNFNIIPQPYLGNIKKAKIIILLLNPGLGDAEETVELECQKLREAQIKSLDPKESYNFFLEDDFEWTVGGEWIRNRLNLKKLIKEINPNNPEAAKQIVMHNVMIVEYFPYHSKKYKHEKSLESQKYGFELVKEAMEKNKHIIITRSERLWYDAVCGLEKYPNKTILKNYRNTSITPGNMNKGNFDKIVEILKS